MKTLVFFIVLLVCSIQSCTAPLYNKINGVSFVASREPISKADVQQLVNINSNYVALMPFGFMGNASQPNLVFNTERQWFGETGAGVRQYAQGLKAQNLKIMLKPQLWVSGGVFTGFIEMDSDANWKVLEKNYSDFILNYAQIAQEINAEMFCMGTELEAFVRHRPKFWNELIKQIKQVYKGKLTYAANWNEFDKTPFWNQLDFIGIDAYFPVSESKTPTVNECKAAWKKHKNVMLDVLNRYDKPILFTEFGYRSIDYCGKEPWNSDRNLRNTNLQAQANATQALFDMFWKESWFAGGFVWKWHHDHKTAGGKNNNQFTPQNKPVEALIKKQYGQF